MEKITKYLDYVIYWAIVLIPFSMAISPAPTNVFMGLLIFAFLLKKILKRERLFIRTKVDIPLVSLFIITCISLINSLYLKDTLRGGVGRLFYFIFIFYIITEELKDKKHIKRVIFAAAAGLILTSVDCIWQVITGHDFIRGYDSVVNIGMVRATASFKDPNTLGIYLSALAPLILGLTLYYFKGKKKIGMLLVSILALAGIILTYSRPTLLAIYVVLLFFGFVRKDKALITLLIVLTLVSPFILPKSVKGWAREVNYNPLRFMCNDDRIAVYRHSLNMIEAHPFIGLGANTYMKNYKRYKEYPEYRNVITSDYMYAHNIYLHMAAEIGLIGLGIFIWLLFKLFIKAGKIYRDLEGQYLKVISLSLSASLIAFLVNGLTESSLYSSRVAIIFWYISGFLLALDKFTHANSP